MEIEIYADVIFIINFLMDFFIFWVMNKFIKKVHISRLIIGSLTASLSYCILIFLNVKSFFFSTFFMFFSIVICFMPQTIKESLKLFFSFALISFFIGGMATGLFYFLNSSSFAKSLLSNEYQHFSIIMLIFSTAIMYILIKSIIRFYKQSIIKKQTFCKINVYYGNEKTELNALIDTGNSLCEPITNSPVIIAEFKAVKKLFPMEIRDTINKEMSFDSINKISKKLPIRIIPFSAIGSEHGILLGFNAEKAEILADKIITVKNATIAIYNSRLSQSGIYNALLNPEMLSSQQLQQNLTK